MDHGSILKCIIDSERITVITLDKIFRQAAESKIILNAHRVNSGEYFIDDKERKIKKRLLLCRRIQPRKNTKLCNVSI